MKRPCRILIALVLLPLIVGLAIAAYKGNAASFGALPVAIISSYITYFVSALAYAFVMELTYTFIAASHKPVSIVVALFVGGISTLLGSRLQSIVSFYRPRASDDILALIAGCLAGFLLGLLMFTSEIRKIKRG